MPIKERRKFIRLYGIEPFGVEHKRCDNRVSVVRVICVEDTVAEEVEDEGNMTIW